MLLWDRTVSEPDAALTIHALTLSEVVRRTKSRELTARGVVEAMLERIERCDGEFGAYVSVLGERALAQAEGLDAKRASGAPLGILHGAPIALKDLLATKGLPTSCGTAVLKDWRPEEDATVVRRLEEAGAVVLGKVKLTEGAYAEHHPTVSPPKNPWAEDRWTGVSSSGSGVAVAAGLAHGAIGTDTGGSIRFPSAACGLVGVKPTYGRVSRHGVFPLADSLDHIGPMTRSVEDAARMLQAMAGHDPQDATSLDAPVPAYAAQLASGLEGVVIGVDREYNAAAVPAVVRAIDDALNVLQGGGAKTASATLPNCEALVDEWGLTCGVEAARAHAATFPSRKDEYGPALTGLLELGLRASSADYDRLEQARTAFRAGLDDLLQRVDALIAPCMPGPIPAAERSAAVREQPRAERFIRYTAPFDYSGHPSVTLPFGMDDGLPVCFQLIGPRLGEARLLVIASALERAANFRYPHLAA